MVPSSLLTQRHMSFFVDSIGKSGCQLVVNRATFSPYFAPIFVTFLGPVVLRFHYWKAFKMYRFLWIMFTFLTISEYETRHKMRLTRFSYKRRRSPPEVIPVASYTPIVSGAGARITLCGCDEWKPAMLRWKDRGGWMRWISSESE